MPPFQEDERKCQKYACALQDCLAKQRHIVNDPVEVCRMHFDSHQRCMENARSKNETIKKYLVSQSGMVTPKE
ncbi:hypothetical protein FisN_2Lu025 [Fistulifera solaris]|uniref:COX assembly mitochondrial protein n=1 Tax=Fistulifera solaris TaxID=1519565 RepID=A0A1Z5JWI6_FISSO|nr:hypothetical protein FisN_2Lu025 [Fistulifera solaris]|eukprot:GAX18403.1 hypothetical protein FisN_2Lu025 [Fistulifera solaris]